MFVPFSKANFQKTVLATALLLLVIPLVYYQTLLNGFVDYDDPAYVTDNPYVKDGFSVEGFKWAFSPSFLKSHFYSYHPLTWVSHQLDVELFGLKPFFHHLTNLLLHLANAILLFIFILIVTGNYITAAGGALLFAIHPVRVEPVAWVASRKDLLSSFFWLLSMHWYIHIHKRYLRENLSEKAMSGPIDVKREPEFSVLKRSAFERDYLILFLFCLCSLMSKSMAVTLPVTLLLMDYLIFSRGTGEDLVTLLREKSLLFIVTGCWIVLAWWGQKTGGALSQYGSLDFYSRLGNCMHSYCMYCYSFIFPVNLAVLYPLKTEYFFSGFPFVALISGIVFTWWLTVRWRELPLVLFGWLWFLVTALPVSGFIPLGEQGYADRFVYLPSFGLALIFPLLLSLISQKRGTIAKLLGFAFLVVVCLVFMFLSYFQTLIWKDSVTLFKQALLVTSENFIIHNNLAALYRREGRDDLALKELKSSLQIKPDFYEALVNLGNIELSGSNFNSHDKSNGMDDSMEKVINNLYRASSETIRKYPELCFNFALFLEEQKKYDEAEQYYKLAIQLRKGKFAKASNNLGNLYRLSGQQVLAENCFKAALNSDASFTMPLFNLALLYHQQGKFDLALEFYRQLLKIDGKNINALGNAGAAAASLKKYGEAMKFYKKALEIDDNNSVIKENLATVLSITGSIEEVKSLIKN